MVMLSKVMDRPMVSVWLITYNHELYITEAIKGVLMQQTTFTVEIIIGEDCSTDNTRAIVKAYKDQYPDQITLFLPDQNLGMLPILRPTYSLCRGKYIAMLDGDDYWTDPLKLQKQVDQLEQDSTIRFNCHPVHILQESTGKMITSNEPIWRERVDELDLVDFLHNGNSVVTLSVLFRNDLGALPEWYYELPYPDLALYYLLLRYGGVARYVPNSMGVYRIHDKGWFSSQSRRSRKQHELRFLDSITTQLTQRHKIYVCYMQYNYYKSIWQSIKSFQFRNAIRCWLRLGIYKPEHEATQLSYWHDKIVFAILKYVGNLVYKYI